MPERITILGLGLIGGSIGLGLKKAKIANIEIVGHDRDPDATGRAKRAGAIDKSEWNLLAAVEGASLVILATPVLAIKEAMEQIADSLSPGAIVTDTASTKVQVMHWAESLLPEQVTFIGGHPMAGKEVSGVDNAEAGLFEKAVYCLSPAKNADTKQVDVVVGMVETLGATPYFVDPHEHDGLVAGVSHLPIILSSALVAATTSDPSWREMQKLASTGFRDVSRLASGDPAMNAGIASTNREAVVGWIDRYIDELKIYRQLVVDGGDDLTKEFERVQSARDVWLYGASDDGSRREQMKGMSFAQLLMGDRLAKLTGGFGRTDPKKKK